MFVSSIEPSNSQFLEPPIWDNGSCCTIKRSVTDVDAMYIEKTRWVSFDIKFTRQGFENACWHREACRAIQHAFSKPSLVNLISKDANLVFYLAGSQCWTLFKLVIMTCFFFIIFVLIQRFWRRHSKSATSSWPDNGNMPWDRKLLLGYFETIQYISGVTDNILNFIFKVIAHVQYMQT